MYSSCRNKIRKEGMIFNHTELNGKKNINSISHCNNYSLGVYNNAF